MHNSHNDYDILFTFIMSLKFYLNAYPICLICLTCNKTYGGKCLYQAQEVI